jgi:hypothetical protein
MIYQHLVIIAGFILMYILRAKPFIKALAIAEKDKA